MVTSRYSIKRPSLQDGCIALASPLLFLQNFEQWQTDTNALFGAEKMASSMEVKSFEYYMCSILCQIVISMALYIFKTLVEKKKKQNHIWYN